MTYHANTGSDATDSSVTVPVDNTKYIGSGDDLVATIMGDGKLATDHVHAATMKDATPVRTGYTFAGWATTATATKAEYQPGAKTDPMTKDMDLYAVWTSGTAATTAATSGSGTTTTTKTPQTGDSDYLMLYIVMAVLSLVGIAYLSYDQKKAKSSK
ncbi:MAG: InlB B-repeat-containing protein [Clostridia bacterium]